MQIALYFKYVLKPTAYQYVEQKFNSLLIKTISVFRNRLFKLYSIKKLNFFTNIHKSRSIAEIIFIKRKQSKQWVEAIGGVDLCTIKVGTVIM